MPRAKIIEEKIKARYRQRDFVKSANRQKTTERNVKINEKIGANSVFVKNKPSPTELEICPKV